MGLKTFLTKIWAAIRILFESLPKQLQEAAKIAITITESIKNFDFKNPEMADVIAAIIPGSVDNQIVEMLRVKLPVIITQLRLVNTEKALSQPAQTISSAASTIKNLDSDTKNSFLHALGILITQEIVRLQGGYLSWSDAVYIIEWYYQQKFKGINTL